MRLLALGVLLALVVVGTSEAVAAPELPAGDRDPWTWPMELECGTLSQCVKCWIREASGGDC